MISAPHSSYAGKLELLSINQPVLRAIKQAVPARALPDEQAVWTRMYEHFDPGAEPFASLVLSAGWKGRQQLFQVSIFEKRLLAKANDSFEVFAEKLGWIRISFFPSDAKLNTLGSFVNGQRDLTVVQYWPGRRCTLKIQQDGATYFVKVYPKKFLRAQRGGMLYQTALTLWNATLDGTLPFSVPRPEGWIDATRTLWFHELPGSPWDAERLTDKQPADFETIGRCAGTLTRSEVSPFRVFDGAEQVLDSCAYGSELARRVPQLAASIDEFLALLRASHGSSPSEPLRPVHGDMHPGQWLEAEQDGRLGLLDFDDFSYGDPERDVAFWLTQMQSEYGLSGTAAESFIDGYEAVAGALNEKLMRTYMAHKWLSKALKAACALRPDGASVAQKFLDQARSLLKGKPVSFCGPLEQPQTLAAAASGGL